MVGASDPGAPLTVLVTAAGSGPAVAVLRALRGQDDLPVRLVACDLVAEVAGRAFADRFERVPRVGPEYVEAVLALCVREGVRLIVPASDREALALAAARGRFEAAGVRLAISSGETLAICTDKARLAEALAAAGIATPEAGALGPAVPASAPWPLIVKPRSGTSGGEGVHRVDTPRDLEALRPSLEGAYLWQRFVAGREYTIDLLGDFEGQPVAVVPRERVEIRGGQSYKGRVCEDADLVALGRAVAERLRLVGGANVQCIRDAAGRPWVIEVNPRFAAAVGITIAGGGVNTPAMLALLAAGRVVAPQYGPRHGEAFVARYWSEAVLPADGALG